MADEDCDQAEREPETESERQAESEADAESEAARVPPPRVFISYARDDDSHVDAVRDLWILLRVHGVDAILDLPAAERPLDRPAWAAAQLREVDYVLVVASPAYRRQAEGRAPADEGRDVQFQASLIRNLLFRDANPARPVALPGPDRRPRWRRPPAASAVRPAVRDGTRPRRPSGVRDGRTGDYVGA